MCDDLNNIVSTKIDLIEKQDDNNNGIEENLGKKSESSSESEFSFELSLNDEQY